MERSPSDRSKTTWPPKIALRRHRQRLQAWRNSETRRCSVQTLLTAQDSKISRVASRVLMEASFQTLPQRRQVSASISLHAEAPFSADPGRRRSLTALYSVRTSTKAANYHSRSRSSERVQRPRIDSI